MEIMEVVPFVGIGKVKLGMTKEECRQALKVTPHNQPKYSIGSINFPESDYFLDSSIQVSYDTDLGTVEWIGVNDSITFTILYREIDLFKTPIEEIVERTKKYGALNTEDEELGYTFCFPELGICYWRPAKTEDVDEGLDEVDEDEREYMLQDIERSKYCKQISIFKDGYWDTAAI